MTTRLSEVKDAGCYRVDNVEDLGESSERLKRLGICQNRRLEVLQTGDPMVVRVVGSRVGLSRRLAQNVVVSPESGSSGAAGTSEEDETS